MVRKQATGTGKTKVRTCYGSHPWRCQPCEGGCELIAYVDASGQWETVAIVQPTSNATARALAEFIVGLVNEQQRDSDVLQAAFDALDGLLEQGLTFSTEQDADRVIETLKRRGF
jgi:hypothetical protein